MLNDDERRELSRIEAGLESDTGYASEFAIRAGALDRHDPRPSRWTRIGVVAALLAATLLLIGFPVLALVAAATAAVAFTCRAVVAVRTR